jgi:imidazole glycerol-phosphate synthase subunit HisH
MSGEIVIVDLQICNLASVLQALQQIGAPPHVFATAENIEAAGAILLPGVGAFGDGMANLRQKQLVGPIRRAAERGTPVFGICLGMQLLAERSEEFGVHEGLGLIEGNVTRLTPSGPDFRIPNVGWCDVTATRPSVLFPSGTGGCYYHVHSYHFVPKNKSVTTGTIDYAGLQLMVALEYGNLFGVQFHPEKSQDDGLRVLARFFSALPKMHRPH